MPPASKTLEICSNIMPNFKAPRKRTIVGGRSNAFNSLSGEVESDAHLRLRREGKGEAEAAREAQED